MDIKDKKNHILNIAEQLFAAKGFEASTVRDIAEAANVNLAMISYYFGSKEKMLETLFQERMHSTQLRVSLLMLDKTIPPFEKVEIMLDEYIKKVLNNEHFYKILLCEQVLQKNTEIIKLLGELKINYANMFTDLVKEGQSKKIFKKNVDVMMMQNTMTGTVTQLMINKAYYVAFNKLEKLSKRELNELLHKNVFTQLKEIFKTILGYES